MAAAVLGVAIAPSATAVPSDDAEASAQLIDVDGLGLDLVEALGQQAGFPSDPGPATGDIDADVLDSLLALDIDLGDGLSVPVIGDGTNGGLLDLGPMAEAGALGSYAAAEDATTATGSTGAVNDSGVVDLDPIADPGSVDNARLDLTALLDQLEVAGLTDELVDEVSIGLGAVAARADATDVGTYDAEYVLSDAELQISSPAVGEVASTLDATYDELADDLDATLDAAVGTGGTLDDALNLLVIPPLNVLGLVTLGINDSSAAVDLEVPALSDAVLSQAVSDDGLVTIDLTDGTIAVDVAQLVKGEGGTDLNGLPANTAVLTDETIEAITAGIAEALGNVVDSINAALVTALEDATLTVTLDGQATALLAAVSVPVQLTVTGSLASFAGLPGAPAPVVASTTAIVIDLPFPLVDINIPAGALVTAVGGTILPLVTGAVGPIVATLLTTESAAVESGLVAVVDTVLDPLEPVLDGVLSQIVSLTINEQPTEAPINGEGDLGPDSFTVRALGIDLLPGLLGIGVDLASASVRASDLPAALTASPDPVQQGGTVTATATNFAPDTAITITYVDAGGATVETSELTTNGSGDVTDSVVLPDDVALGTLTVTADDGTDELTDSVQVVAVPDEAFITASPDPVQVGGTLEVDGLGFLPNSPLTVLYFDSDGENIATSSLETDGAGGFTDSIVIPPSTQLGTLEIAASDGTNTAEGAVQVIAPAAVPALTASPDPVQQGGTVTASGVGFAPSTPVTVTYTDAGGAVVDTNEVISDGAGGFSDAATVPDDAPLGDLTVTADDGTDADTDTVQVVAAAAAPGVTASPDPVQRGGTLTATGVGFAPSTPVSLTYTDADGAVIATEEVLTDGAGGFSDSITVPGATPLGELTVSADDGTDAAEDTVRVIAAAVVPGVTASPDPVQQGGTLTATGVGFAPSTPVTVTYTDADGAVVETSEEVTDASGGFSDSITVPAGTPLGDLVVSADDGTDTADDTVQVIAAAAEPSVTASPDPVQQGGTVTATGVGFAPSTPVTVTYTDADGAVVDTNEVISDGAGGFSDSATVPADAPLGELTVTADDGTDTDTDTVEVVAAAVAPSVTASPDPVQQGGTVTADGVGFAPSTAVTVTYTDADGETIGTNVVVTDGAGGFSDAITVPADTPLGALTVTADDGTDTADDTVQVVAAAVEPGVTASPDPVQQGGTLTATAVGFAPSAPVTVTYTDADGVEIDSREVVTDGAGGFSDSITVPADTPLGDLTVTADDGTDTAEDVVEVVAAAVEPGVTASPDPVQQGGTVTADGVGFAPGTAVTVTYTDADGATIDTNVVVTDGAGGFSDSATVPADAPLGELTVTADDGTDTAEDSVQVVAAADEPSVTASPDPVQQGGDLEVVGVGFEPNTPVTIVYTDADGEVVETSEVTTDGAGGFTDTITVPEDTPLGDLTIEADDGTDTVTETVEVVEAADEPSVTASPDPVQVGGTVEVVGVGFAPDSPVTVTYTDADGVTIATNEVTTDGAGGFTDDLVVPDGTPLGELTVSVSDGDVTAEDSVQVVAAADEPSVTASPDPVQQGGDLEVVGVGFAPNTSVTVTYTDADGEVIETSTVVTDGAGGFTDTITVPADTPLGDLSIEADDGTDTATEVVEVVEAADEPGVTASPDPVAIGSPVTVTGAGFAPDSSVTITLTDADGDVVATRVVPTDGAGGFSQSITVPEGTALGALTVDAEDAEGGTASDVVEVIAAPAEPTVEASPDPVEIGEDITVVGEGFPPNTEITVTYTDSEGNVVGENVVTTDEDGGFTDTFTVPEGTSVGTLEVEATGGGETATDTTTVLEPGAEYEPEIEVTPGTVPPGQPVTTECVGFPPNTDVTITYTDSTGRVVATREVRTDAEGGCTDTVTLPEDTAPGPLTVSATGGGFTAEETVFVVDPDAITIDIAEPTLYRGDVQTGTGSGYAPGTVVQGFMNSTPQLDLGTQVADENGDVTFTWTIPANAAIDTHTFSLTADGYPDQSVGFQVLATPGPGLPGTGADVAMAGFAASGMFLVGLLLMAATRVAARRRNGVL